MSKVAAVEKEQTRQQFAEQESGIANETEVYPGGLTRKEALKYTRALNTKQKGGGPLMDEVLRSKLQLNVAMMELVKVQTELSTERLARLRQESSMMSKNPSTTNGPPINLCSSERDSGNDMFHRVKQNSRNRPVNCDIIFSICLIH